MWYVNKDLNLFKAWVNKCFILTMWYVNLKLLAKFSSVISTFYINYVVCKFSKYRGLYIFGIYIPHR